MKLFDKLFLLLTLLLLISCKKDEMELLPSASMTGADTMGAIVNGKAWVANGGKGFQGPKPVEGGYTSTLYDQTRNNVYIQAYKKDNTKIQLYLRDVSKPGEYPLNITTNLFGGELKQPENYGVYIIPGKVYMTTSKYKGMVSITKADTVNKIVSGTFSFEAEHGQESIKVSYGRFDVSTLN